MKRYIPFLILLLLVSTPALLQPQDATFEGAPVVPLSSGKLNMMVSVQGASLVSLVMTDDAEKLNPMWNPIRLAREQGRQAQFSGSAGHFVCVDGFGQVSNEERAAGLMQHGEAHTLKFAVTSANQGSAKSVTMKATLPIVQENFTRTFRMVGGENVVYVDSELENLLGFDRPVNWGEHATVSAPFLEPEVSFVTQSSVRSQVRDYTRNQNNAAGRGGATNANPSQRRLAPGQDFTWPMAPGLDGKMVDMSAVPVNPHYIDHTATLFDQANKHAWMTAINTRRHLVYGYIINSNEYPWVQRWANYPGTNQVVHGMEFATQPYDVPRKESIGTGSLFGTPTYRWLPAKSKIESHFLLFYARLPEGFQKVDDVRLENGKITIEDRTAKKQVTLAASRGLQ